MSSVERFEDLRIWQEARTLANQVYTETRELTDFTFRDQARSAAISIMNNIAEGFERGTDADFARFLDIAKGSSGEIRSMLHLAEDLGYVSSGQAGEMRSGAGHLSAGIATFAKYLRR